MSTVESDLFTGATTNGNAVIKGNGTGKVALGDGSLLVPDTDGTVDQVLKTDGAGNLGFATAAGGAWAVKSSGTFSAVSSLEVTSIAKTARILLTGTTFSVDGGNVSVTVSTDNGTTYASTGYYLAVRGSDSATNANNDNIASNGSALFFTEGVGSAAGENLSLDLLVTEPESTSTYTKIFARAVATTPALGIVQRHGAGEHQVAQNTDAIKFTTTSGTFSGTYTVLELN